MTEEITQWEYVDDAERIVELIVSHTELPEAAEQSAKSLVTQMLNLEDWEVTNRSRLAASAVYVASRIHDNAYTAGELHEITRKKLDGYQIYASEKDIQTGLSTLNEYLPIAVNFGTVAPNYAKRHGKELNCRPGVIRAAVQLAELSSSHQEFSGCAPSAIAAASIYNASMHHGYSLTQREVAEVIDTTAASIRSHYEQQWEMFGDELDVEEYLVPL